MTIRIFLIVITLFIAACTSGNLEPGSDGIPITREAIATATAENSPTPINQETPLPTPASSLTLTPPSTAPDLQIPTRTPVPPFPGFQFVTADGIWQVNGNWQPEMLTDNTNAVISPDNAQAIYLDAGDIWLLDLANNESRNLTEGLGRIHCCLQWAAVRSNQLLFGSWADIDSGPSSGHLTVMNPNGSEYTVLSENESNALPAFSPDGQQIAYDQAGSAWIYDYGTNTSSQLDPIDYGLENVQRIAGPSWSPDGSRLAWTIAIANPDWQIAIAVFNLQTMNVDLYHTYSNIGRGGWFPGPVWHPDGEWLAFLAEDIDPEKFGIWVVNTITFEEAFLGRGHHPLWSPDGRWLTYREFENNDSAGAKTWLVEVGSWHHINLFIPDDGRLLNWLLP